MAEASATVALTVRLLPKVRPATGVWVMTGAWPFGKLTVAT